MLHSLGVSQMGRIGRRPRAEFVAQTLANVNALAFEGLPTRLEDASSSQGGPGPPDGDGRVRATGVAVSETIPAAEVREPS